MRNITQKEVTAIQNHHAPTPERAMFEIVVFGGSKQKYHAVHSDNAHFFLEKNQFLAESADGKTVSVIHIDNIRVPEKKPHVQKKRKKYTRPTGTGYLEKIPFDFDKLEVGDNVQLRSGKIDVITAIDGHPIYPVVTKNSSHTTSGKIIDFDWQEHKGDIIYILKKTKNPTPKKDKWEQEFVLLDRSTGNEVVFTRKELQIVKEVMGKVGSDRPMCWGFIYNKFADNGFKEYTVFTNSVELVPTGHTPLFKENV